MQFLPTILLVAIAATAEAACYGTGDEWPNREDARVAIVDACKKQNGMFTGYYEPLQSKAMCIRTNHNGIGLFFQVKNENPRAGFDLGDDDCEFRLNNEIFQCPRGGETHVDGWYFRADPGNC